MKKLVIPILIGIVFTGCAVGTNNALVFEPINPYNIHSLENKVVKNKSLEIKIPSSHSDNPWLVWQDNVSKVKSLILFRNIPNMMNEDIRFFVYDVPQELVAGIPLLIKQINKNIEFAFQVKSNQNPQNITSFYLDYISGLKCFSSSKSPRPMASNLIGVDIKNRSSICYYYSLDNKVKVIAIDYTNIYTYYDRRLQNSTEDSLENYTKEEIQSLFKKDIKEVFDSLQILDMDIEKMEENDLLHSLKYNVNNEYKSFKEVNENEIVEIFTKEMVLSLQDIYENYSTMKQPYILYFNPSYGLIGDLLEDGVRKMGGKTGMDKQIDSLKKQNQ